MNFFLTSLTSLHISVNANKQVWDTYFANLIPAFYIKNVVADILPDGSISNAPS
jgi:hypothetical protein